MLFRSQNEWNQSITICHNCRNDITQDVKFVSKIDANFQLKFYDIIRTSRLKGKKMDPIHFLQKIWRVAQNVSLDSKIKEEEGITTERMFVALNLADKFIECDQKRLEEPYVCPYDGTNFSNSIELNLHLTQEHNQNIMSDPCLIERYALIKPFIEQGITNKNDILRMAINLNLSFHSVYKWVRVYKKYGFIGLAKKKRVKGRRSKRFSDAIYQILEDNVAKYNEKTMTPRSCCNKIVQECRKLPDDQSKIPSMTTVANRIKRQLNLRKFESF